MYFVYVCDMDLHQHIRLKTLTILKKKIKEDSIQRKENIIKKRRNSDALVIAGMKDETKKNYVIIC